MKFRHGVKLGLKSERVIIQLIEKSKKNYSLFFTNEMKFRMKSTIEKFVICQYKVFIRKSNVNLYVVCNMIH